MTEQKLCIVCGVGPREVPYRDAINPGKPVKKVCRQCHGKRLQQDLREIVALSKQRRPTNCVYRVREGPMSDLVAELREYAKNWRVETVITLIAQAADEIERLNSWADGFSDAQIKERQTAEAYQRELREYISKLQNMLHERGCCQWAIDRMIGDAP